MAKPSPMLSWTNASLGLAVLIAAVAAPAEASAADQPATALEPAFAQVSVNGQDGGEPLLVLRGPAGEFYLPDDAARRWRLRLDPSSAVIYEGKPFLPLANVEGLSFAFAEDNQSLEVTAAPRLLLSSIVSVDEGDQGPMTASGRGGFLNYELFGQYSEGDSALSSFFELGIFAGAGFGTSTFAAGLSSARIDFTRLDTNWTIDDPDRLRSLRLGDGITRGGIGGSPVRFSGVQFGSNFAVQPGFVTIPLPTLNGSAALPSVIDIYVNNSLRQSRKVAPGPFSVIDVPVLTGSGEVQLIVRDILGRETLINQPYYAARQMLRRGLHDYSFEAGLLRNNYARRSFDYGAPLVSTTQRFGLTDRLTAEAHAEASLDTQTAGVSGIFVIPGIGLVEASAAASNSDDGRGGLAGLSIEHQGRGVSFGARSEFTTRDFANLGSLRGREPAASTIQLFAGLPLGFGSIGASYLIRDSRGEPDTELISANASVRLGQLGTLQLTARKNFKGDKDQAVAVSLSTAFGSRSSASSGIQRDRFGTSSTADFQRNLPAGPGIGYRLSATLGAIDRLNGRLSVLTATGNYDAELTWTDGRTGVRMVAGGAIATVGGKVFLARKLSQSFATVKVDRFDKVRVYADNQLVGRTNRHGVAIVPRLRPFERNQVRIEVADLPIDTSIAGAEQSVRPFNRSGIAIDFGVKRSRGALLTVLLEGGTPLPAGSTVRLEGNLDEFVSAPGGEVYLTGLASTGNFATASFDGGTCRFGFDVPASDDPQPNLGQLTCAAK